MKNEKVRFKDDLPIINSNFPDQSTFLQRQYRLQRQFQPFGPCVVVSGFDCTYVQVETVKYTPLQEASLLLYFSIFFPIFTTNKLLNYSQYGVEMGNTSFLVEYQKRFRVPLL